MGTSAGSQERAGRQEGVCRCTALTPLIRTVHLQLCAERCGQGSSIGLPSIAKLAANWLLLPPVLIIHALLVQLTASLQDQAGCLSELVQSGEIQLAHTQSAELVQQQARTCSDSPW